MFEKLVVDMPYQTIFSSHITKTIPPKPLLKNLSYIFLKLWMVIFNDKGTISIDNKDSMIQLVKHML
jgi:hypothetical protein